MGDDDISGSVSLYDVSNPDKPIFEGDFKNSEEMNEIRKNLIDKMLNSQKEFKGKKMTKQEMLDSLNLRELKAELKIAVEAEDWLWAASLRDKIAEKEKKDNTDL
jgi:protein-arginine kinase activator protein McsA